MATIIQTIVNKNGDIVLPRTRIEALSVDDQTTLNNVMDGMIVTTDNGVLAPTLSIAATDVAILDEGAYYSGGNVELALQQVGATTDILQTQLDTKTSTGKAIAMAIVFGG